MTLAHPGEYVGHDLVRRAQVAVSRAREIVAYSTVLSGGARNERAAALICRRAARRGQAASRPRYCYARVTGFVTGDPVLGVARSDGSVVADDLLLERADLLVRLGETFVGLDGGVHPASLRAGPLIATLTMVRACDAATTVDLMSSARLEG